MSTIALYSGSFDPVTFGHLDIIARAAGMFDEIIVAVGAHHTKTALLTLDQRLKLLANEVSALGIKNVRFATFDGLVVDAAIKQGAVVIVRGLRNSTDYDYETQMAAMNRQLNSGIDTVFLQASPATDFIASSLVKQIARLGEDISAFVPKNVETEILDTLKK